MKNDDTMIRARKYSSDYVKFYRKFENAHAELEKVIPYIKVMSRVKNDYNMERLALSVHRLTKYLTDEDRDTGFNKKETFAGLIAASSSR